MAPLMAPAPGAPLTVREATPGWQGHPLDPQPTAGPFWALTRLQPQSQPPARTGRWAVHWASFTASMCWRKTPTGW
ncbi:hypothetical protein [Ideonella paludis]|uniref:hypothetical protein n=1 Tax=Ideonella paludis TaxID=1233411 RepID=UPI00363DBFB0